MTVPSPTAPPGASRPRLAINVEMDDRSVLFPDGEFLSHISAHETNRAGVRLETLFRANKEWADPTLDTLAVEDAREFGRAILGAVLQGRTQHVLSETPKIALLFNSNGFVLKFEEERALRDLFIASPDAVRLTQGVRGMLDRASTVPHH